MKKALVLALAVFATTVNADWSDPMEPFNANNKVADRMSVEWIAVDNIQATCEAESRKRGNNGFGYPLHACSFWTKQSSGYVCTIYTKRNPTTFTMGHELRHCFQGNYHQ